MKLATNTYTAQISRNLREIHSTIPKVLLRGVQSNKEDIRDHMWVPITPAIETLLKSIKSNKVSLVISFEAKAKEYDKRLEGILQTTLISIKNIKILGRA